MAFHSWFLLLAKLVCVICFMDQTDGTPNSVEWYRTAQNTNDRIAKQPDLTFGEDFSSSDPVISINRYVSYYYCTLHSIQL